MVHLNNPESCVPESLIAAYLKNKIYTYLETDLRWICSKHFDSKAGALLNHNQQEKLKVW